MQVSKIPGVGRHKIGGVVRNSFNSANPSSHSVVHRNFSLFFKHLKNGNARSTNLHMKRDKEATLPLSRCTYFTLLRLHIWMIALHFSKLASIPRLVSIQPKNLSACIPNEHFSVFSLRSNPLMVLKVSFRSF